MKDITEDEDEEEEENLPPGSWANILGRKPAATSTEKKSRMGEEKKKPPKQHLTEVATKRFTGDIFE